MELIKIDQIDIMHNEILKDVKLIDSLVANEDSIKLIKQMRADLTKRVKGLEKDLKDYKDYLLTDYNIVQAAFKESITKLYKDSDLKSKLKINEIENERKGKKKLILMEYFTEYAQSLNIDFVTIEDLIDVKLSTSIKKYKEEIKTKLDKIDFDRTLIYTQDNKDEIMYEYKISFNVNDAILKVKERKEAIKVVEQVNTKLDSPIVEEVYKVDFTVWVTSRQGRDIKKYFEKEGIKYE